MMQRFQFSTVTSFPTKVFQIGRGSGAGGDAMVGENVQFQGGLIGDQPSGRGARVGALKAIAIATNADNGAARFQVAIFVVV